MAPARNVSEQSQGVADASSASTNQPPKPYLLWSPPPETPPAPPAPVVEVNYFNYKPVLPRSETPQGDCEEAEHQLDDGVKKVLEGLSKFDLNKQLFKSRKDDPEKKLQFNYQRK